MSESLGLGKLITTPQKRDAVHVAVVPVIADEPLAPGQRACVFPVKRADGEYAYHAREGGVEAVGIIDPFLRERVVMAGQECWLWLDPGSITSLRHDWTHPAFVTNPALAEYLAKKGAAREQ